MGTLTNEVPCIVFIEAPGKYAWFRDNISKHFSNVEVVFTKGKLFDIDATVTAGDLRTTLDKWAPIAGRPVEYVVAKARDAKKVIIATDDDIEGDLIASHIARFLPADAVAYRLRLNSLTPRALEDALLRAEVYLDAGATAVSRRCFDYIVGTQIPPAGTNIPLSRIFSNALSQIDKFTFSEYLLDGSVGDLGYVSEGINLSGDDFDPLILKVSDFKRNVVQPTPTPKFLNTADLLIGASLSLNEDVEDVYSAAQELYEQGLITYIRTDSQSASSESLSTIRQFADGLGMIPIGTCAATAVKGAHQAILPTGAADFPIKSNDSKLKNGVYNYIALKSIEAMYRHTYSHVKETHEAEYSVGTLAKKQYCRAVTSRNMLVVGPGVGHVRCLNNSIVPFNFRLSQTFPSKPVQVIKIPKVLNIIRMLSNLALCPPGQLIHHAKRISRYVDDHYKLTYRGSEAVDLAKNQAPFLLSRQSPEILMKTMSGTGGALERLISCLNHIERQDIASELQATVKPVAEHNEESKIAVTPDGSWGRVLYSAISPVGGR